RVSAVVRGGDAGDLPAGGHPRPAAGHDRQRRRRMHDTHSQQEDQSDPEDRPMTEQIVSQAEHLASLGRYEYGWAASDAAGAAAKRGLGEEVVRDISAKKNEPAWMLDLRLKGLRLFGRKPLPAWGADLSTIDFDNIKYFVRSTEKQAASW